MIERVLRKAEQVGEDDMGFVAADTMDGMIVKIWYRTIGDDKVLVRSEAITDEQWDWEKHGCKNAEDWRRYLNKNLWSEYKAGLK